MIQHTPRFIRLPSLGVFRLSWKAGQERIAYLDQKIQTKDDPILLTGIRSASSRKVVHIPASPRFREAH